ncbi:hypothetical protein GUITHDRAFT_49465, partial [Guillardia theta CCMP2712]
GDRRSLSFLNLIGIMYFAVSGGPEGTEGIISAGGPKFALLGIAATSVLWSMPIALLSAEMVTAVPQNGGPMVWSRAAFGAGTAMGDFVAFLAGWLSFLFTAVDAALYPSMFMSYLVAGTGIALTPVHITFGKLLFVAALTAHNVAGVESVGASSSVMIIALLAPFVAFIFVAFTGVAGWAFSPGNWLVGALTPSSAVDYTVLLLWNMGMWESAASCAGEVQNPSKTFPRALAAVLFLVVLNYALPIMAFTGVDDNYDKYVNGYYVKIATQVGGKAFGSALALGQCISTIGLFSNSVVKNSYLLCGMGEQTLLPKLFSDRWSVTNAPIFSIAASSLVTVIMVMLDSFSVVLSIDMMLYSMVLMIEIAAFIKLRYSFPDLQRGYKIPISGPWLFIFFTPVIAFGILLICTTSL